MRTRLPSGLTVITEENHAAPVAALQVWVKVGSADERPDEAGLAHLHEHMLFKGTPRRAPGQIAREIEGAGGEINAWTSFDQTVYHVVVASRFLEQGLDVLGDALTSASFDPDELAREIEVVCEEIKRSEDSPSRKLSKALFAAAFQKHPYGRPVIGTEQSVRSFRRDGILQFYRRHYRADNCTLVAVGDFEPARVVALAEKLFRFAAAPALLPEVRQGEPPRAGPQARLLRSDVREGYLTLAWPAPSLADPDAPAMDALSIVLGHGEASRLYRALKRDRLLCTEAHASCYTPNDPGLTLVGLTLQPKTLREAVAEALRQTYRLRSEEVSEEELLLACSLLESDAVYQRETVQGQARKLGSFETGAGGLEFEEEYFRRVAALTPQKLRAVAERRIDPRQVVLAALLPEGQDGIDVDVLQKLLTDAAEAERNRPRAPRSPAQAAAPRVSVRVAGSGKTSPIVREVLPNGAVLIVKEERAVPLLAMRAVWPGGQRAEDESSAGINTLLSRLATTATARRTAEQIAREMEAMGGGCSGNSGRNSFGLRAELLSKHLANGLSLFHELLAAPAFDAQEVARETELQKQELATRDDDPSGVAFQLFQETLYQRHPYRLDVLGNAGSLAAVTGERLAAYRARHYPPAGAVLSVVGDVDPAEVRERVLALFNSTPTQGGPAERPSPAPEPRVTAPRRAVRRLEKAQAHLVLGFPGLRLDDDKRFALEVLSAVLSGQGGRLFVELRDKKSLAYTVTSFSIEGVDPGYFAVYIACSPHKLREAAAGIRAELDQLRQAAPTAVELDRARTHLVGTHAIGLQRNGARAAVYAFDECYGLGVDASARYPERIAAVGAEEVLACARTILDANQEVVALVAPAAVEL